MRSDVFFFLTVFGFFFLLWVSTGGPTRPISFTGPYITPITGEHQTQVGYGGSEFLNSPSRGGSSSRSSSQYGSDSGNSSNFGTPSQYKGEVMLSYSANQSSDPSQEYVELYASSGNAKKIDITGWKLVSTVTGNNVNIPVGVKLVQQGVGNVLGDISLSPGDTTYVVSGRSPIGLSYKENECIGYFGDQASRSQMCPSAVDEFNKYYPGNPLSDDACYSFVQSVNSCQVPGIPGGLTAACRSFISQHLSYNGCVTAHADDSNFYGSTWHIYLNSGGSLWKSSREQIKLLDASGKTVDMITY